MKSEGNTKLGLLRAAGAGALLALVLTLVLPLIPAVLIQRGSLGENTRDLSVCAVGLIAGLFGALVSGRMAGRAILPVCLMGTMAALAAAALLRASCFGGAEGFYLPAALFCLAGSVAGAALSTLRRR